MSSRRVGAGSRRSSSSRKQALEEIKRMRDGVEAEETTSSSRLAQYKPQEESIYKAVTDQEYEELVRQRRQGLPFVENDDGEMGYYDDGEEQFFESDPEDTGAAQDEDDSAAGKKRSAGALSSSYVRRAKKMQRAKLGGGEGQKITNMFFSASSNKTKTNGAAPGGVKRTTAKRDIDLDSMLDDLTSNPTESRAAYARPMSYATGSSTFSSGTSSGFTARKPFSANTSSFMSKDNTVEEEDTVDYGDNTFEPDEDEPMQEASADEEREASTETEEVANHEAEPAKPVMSKREMMLRKAREQRLQTSAPTARALAAPVEQKLPEDGMTSSVPSNEVAEWWHVAGDDDANVSMADASADDAEPETLPSAADSIQMYWMDAVEVRERPGKIYLIGKMKIPSPEGSNQPPTFRSCCVVVNNLQRFMYLVPKGTPLIELSNTEQQEAWMKMHEEIHNILIPSCITNRRDQEVFKTKLVERNYAFEEANIPRGKNQFLKVKYPAKYPAPPSDFCSRGGKTFSRICGAFTRPLENFLLTRRLLGPGWVEIKGVRKCTEGVSFCKMEFETFDPKNVSPIAGGMSPPPLSVMSLSLKSVCNPNTGKHEVVALSAITETGISSEGAGKGTKGAKQTLSHFTAIRPLDENHGFPQAYAEAVQRDDRFGMKMENGALGINSERLRVEINERVMLSYFLTRVQLEDPDVIVGHNLHKYALELLISRIDNFRLGGLWSKLTRLRRGRLNPMNVGEGWNEYRMDDMVNGRLFCDTYVSSKELLPSQNNYTLSYLVERLLHKQRLDVEMTEIPQILLGGPNNFVKFLRHTLDDAMFVLHLMHKLEILPLSKQLANLCGYMWTRTLEANKRAERIEYLLLHEFSRSKNKFIVPEKFKSRTEADKSNKRREASYAGGMVFAPKKGLYDNFVVLLDFMSLYPSIIREYNICFTTVERQLNEDVSGAPSSSKKKKKSKPMPQPENDEVVDDEDMDQNLDNADASADSEIPALPSSASEPGVLPAVIKRLLESRKQVKQQLKIEQKEGNVEKANMLDIRQKAIKLTANSMYGCLGFRFSRFYAKPIAALITSTGRQTLQRAKEVAEQECGYDVIYGDTDSIMVDSRTETLDEAKRIGREIQAQCNKHFKLLELEVDYIFKRILLLNKKKYAALVMKERPNSEPTFDKEVKGLDMVRRDWCVISKAVGNEVLDFILSGNSRDDVVESIHEHLEQVAERMRSGKEPIEQYVITKSLNKQPEQYPDRAKQYHVQVALALRALGKPVGAGTHIAYVLCKEEEPGSGRRAYHPDEVKRANGKLNIDVEWYLESQIHPPVNRLCAHIEGTSSPQLAHCLGLDTAKFSHSANHFEENDGGDAIPSVLQNDADRFKDCVPLEITCDRCKMASAFPGVFGTSEKDSSLASGLLCPVCKADFWGFDKEGIYGNVGDDLQAVLSNRLHIATRQATKKYYEAWTVCSDVTCKTRTQKQSLRGNGNICSAAGCRATTTLEYPDSALYTQLKYFESLFDAERAQKKIREQKERVTSTTTVTEPPPLSERHRAVLQKLLSQAEEAVHRDDYNWVKPSIWQTLFT
ncbi:DNA polymerase alpha zinc finger [Phytophthora infestans]|uniref:DNA polymerase n=2 Tax=Phytophthora infestans TaxID=4787 RepID=A0A8S9V6K3_PHYIN|nr:DNA polymerase alpha zinc finger [Phytophthora infestans]